MVEMIPDGSLTERALTILDSEHMTNRERELLLDASLLGQPRAANRHGVSRSTVSTVCMRHSEVYQQLRTIRTQVVEGLLGQLEYLGVSQIMEFLGSRGRVRSVADASAVALLTARCSELLDRMRARRSGPPAWTAPDVPGPGVDVVSTLMTVQSE